MEVIQLNVKRLSNSDFDDSLNFHISNFQ